MLADLGFYLAILTFVSIIFVPLFNSRLTIVFGNYYVMGFVGIAFFIYFWVIRYQEDATNYINGTYLINGEHSSSLEANTGNIQVSKAFLLDLCPFSALLMSMLFTFDRDRVVLKAAAPYAFFGGVVSIFGQIINEGVGSANNNFYLVTNGWDFTFGNEGYFLMHYFLIVFSLIILMNSKGYGLYGMIGTVVYILTYFTYVIIIVNIFDVKQNATGLVPGDWSPTGQYATVSKIFGGISFPNIAVLCYSLVAVYIFIWMFLRNIFIFDNKWKHKNIIVFPRVTISLRSVFIKMNKAISNI
ncbi:MAG: DUF5378 family protein [Metamycoplasmataceae bacterium]